ncbi:MAG: 50S ribosomal protein L10 [Gaiellaceae bacterium]
MLKKDKEQVVERLTERIQSAETLIVADYRGLTNAQMEGLRDELLKHGARFAVVKNTLTRRAAEAAGNEALLALLEGPTAIAFLEAGSDPVATAKALSQLARDSRVLAIRGGILEGKAISSDEVEELAKLPPADVLRGQVLGAIVAPVQALAGLVAAPLTNLVGLIDARIEQLGGEAEAPTEPEAAAEPEVALEETSPEAPAAEPEGETEDETTSPVEEAPAAETEKEETNGG